MLIPFQDLVRKYNFQIEGVLHIGASEGQEAIEYHNLKAKRVVWIEAIPWVYDKLVRHISKFQGQEALNYCIGDVDGKWIAFNEANNGGQSSSILELGTHKMVHPEVKYIDKTSMKMRRIDKIDHDFSGLDFLNIDLQGAEMLALKGMGDMIDQFKFLYLEVNKQHLYVGCPLIEEIEEYIGQYGFKRMELQWCGNTNWGDAFYIKKENGKINGHWKDLV